MKDLSPEAFPINGRKSLEAQRGSVLRRIKIGGFKNAEYTAYTSNFQAPNIVKNSPNVAVKYSIVFSGNEHRDLEV